MSSTIEHPSSADESPDRDSEPELGAAPTGEDYRNWTGHVIVCGVQEVVVQTVEQVLAAGARVVVIDDEGTHARLLRSLHRLNVPVLARRARIAESLVEAGIAGAEAVICIESSDLRTLETVLLAQGMREDVQVIAQLDNAALARAVEEQAGDATVIDIATLFAPPVIEACIKRRSHDIKIGSAHFVTVEVVAERDDTLRELYGSLVPLGVASGGDTKPVLCPGRDHRVKERDRVTLLGTREEIEAHGFASRLRAGTEIQQTGQRLASLVNRVIGEVTSDNTRSLRIAILLSLLVVLISSLVLHFAYVIPGGLSLLRSVYFTVETMATVGFGDYSFATQPASMVVFGIALIFVGTTLLSTVFALLTNALVSRQIAASLGQAEIPGMRGHVVMVGLGAVGMEVLAGLLARGRQVVVVERDETNRYLNQVRQRGVPLVLGDATLGQTLDSVNLSRASSVAIMTSNDQANIETGLAVRDRLGERWEEVPVVLRVTGRELGQQLESSFDFRQVWSTSAIAAPSFAGAALGLEVLFSFYVGSHPFLLARLRIAEGGGLDGVAMSELGANVRVIAIGRDAGDDSVGALEHPPRRETRLAAGDDAYLAGPHEELMRILKRERSRD